MAIPPPPEGFTRYLVKSKLGVGRDFRVLDLDEHEVFVVDGKLGLRPKADVLDASGTALYHVTGQLLGIPKRMTITDAGGSDVASLKAKMFSPIKSRMTMTMADARTWELEGNFIEKEYTITAGGERVVQITQKWVTIRDTYTLDISEGVDPGLALAVLWSVDRWVERD
jgi:uncharacterized protein YxjI